MILVEFIAPIIRSPHKDKILAVLYYSDRYKMKESLTVDAIKTELKLSRVPKFKKINVADVLNKSGHFVDSPGTEGSKRLWRLTESGKQYIRNLLGLPLTDIEIEHDVASLLTITDTLNDQQVKDYINEGVKCLQVGALRACVVFLWSGAIRIVQNELLTYNQVHLNTSIKKYDPKTRIIKSIDHFAYVKDKTTILSALDLGMFDKNQKDTLEEALNLRNRCGHPGKYKPGPKKVSSFIEDVVTLVFK
ncbi:MAG: hypothetical protein IH949_10860 [Bacteroidetes bacterium]|nr:hypothetical protein [Bacteroidota bacterium]